MKIISSEEWGISTLKEKDFIHLEQKFTAKFNFWDYIEAFNKSFLYENPRKKHSWFFHIKPEVYNHHIPNCFRKWWIFYGPSPNILPSPFLELYQQYVDICPKLQNKDFNWTERIALLFFLTEFSI